MTILRAARRLAPLLIALVVACKGERRGPAPFEITAQYPHDPSAYTQGLVLVDGILFESTGQYGKSQIRRVDLRSGRVLAARNLAADQFGEGLALVGDRLYQLTWKSGIAYTYDTATLAPRDSFRFAGEGWGLATDGTSLIMSDGSDSLRFLSPKDFHVERVVHVRHNGMPFYKLNELEYVNGDLYANVYQSDWVLRIDPATGEVRAMLDFADLYSKRAPSAEVMNGIAVAPDSGQLLVTGKHWPTIFQVRLAPTAPASDSASR